MLILAFLCSFGGNVAYSAENLASIISQTETKYFIPSGLLSAIAKVESGNKPYALNVAGKTIFADSKEDAIKTVQFYLNQGYTNIDLGVMQVNFHWHGKYFSSIDQMLTPEHNVRYAATLLISLYKQYGSWPKAVRYYHSAKSRRQSQYSRKVLVSWLGS